MKENKKIRVFEAFAGYGGASFGLKKAGIPHEVVGFSEWDKWAIQLFQKNQEARLCIYNRKSVHFKQNTAFRLLSVPSQSCARVRGVQYGEMRDLLNHFAVSNRIYIAS